MKRVVWFCEFSDAFRDSSYAENFSYNGLKALFDYLTNFEEDVWIELELDPIAFCCEYTEYEDFDSFKNDYGNIEDFYELESNTTVIYTGDSRDENAPFIIQNF